MVSVPPIIRRWPAASWLFGFHALLVLVIYLMWRTSDLPYGEREMIWLWLLFIDCPIFFAYIPLVDHASGGVTAFVAILVGGLEWALVGCIFDLLRRRYFTRASVRDA